MTKTNTMDLEKLQQLRSLLQALPPKEKTQFNMREAVKVLHAEIHHLISEHGYTFFEIADAFSQIGVKVNGSTIAAYARELASDHKKISKSKATAQKASGSTQVDVEKRIVTPETELPKATIVETSSAVIETPTCLLSRDQVAVDDVLELLADINIGDTPSAYKSDNSQ